MNNLVESLLIENKKLTKTESKKKVVKESDELSQVQVFDPANFIEYGRFVNRKKLGQYLRDNGYKIVRAYYKDANHNRQSWDMIFSNGKDYIRYRRFAGKGPYASDAPEELIVSSKIPKDSYDRLDQIVSYDYVHDYSKEPDYFKSRFSKDLLIESKKVVKEDSALKYDEDAELDQLMFDQISTNIYSDYLRDLDLEVDEMAALDDGIMKIIEALKFIYDRHNIVFGEK